MRIYRLTNREVFSSDIWWHGTPSGNVESSNNEIHLGTYLAATEALESRIGIPAEGVWDGARKYGETLLASKNKIMGKGKHVTGVNTDAPEDEDYYATGNATYGGGAKIDLGSMPNIISFRIVGPMTNSRYYPHSDQKANSMIRSLKDRGKAKRGYYYKNEGEDSGSISAVVPDYTWLERAN